VEIAPVPHRSVRGERRRLAVGLLVLAPVVLLVLLPTVLGLDRYVTTDRAMEGSLGRGSVVLAREVPPTDLQVGDVITFRPPDAAGADSDSRVTRRVVAIDDGVATTRSDATGFTDPWTLTLTGSSYARVWLSVPWIGYPFLMDGGWLLLVLAAAVALSLAVSAGRRAPQKALRAPRAGLPVS
jgi:signal peptidase I